MKKKANGFTLVELLVVIAILGILMASLFPAISSAILKAQTTAMASNGRNLFLGITGANTEREQAGLPNVWPQTVKVEGVDETDIAGKGPFTSSLKYFQALFDLDSGKYGTKDWRPWVDCDISKLSGSGVPGFSCSSKSFTSVTLPSPMLLTDYLTKYSIMHRHRLQACFSLSPLFSRASLSLYSAVLPVKHHQINSTV